MTISEGKLAPPLGTAERAVYYQWVVYAVATLDDAAVKTYFHKVLLSPERRKAEVVEDHRPTLETACKVLEGALGGKTWLLGDMFSGADIAVGYSLDLMEKAGATTGAPNVTAYVGRLRERPAFKRVYG